MLLIFLVAQRYIVGGITQGALRDDDATQDVPGPCGRCDAGRVRLPVGRRDLLPAGRQRPKQYAGRVRVVFWTSYGGSERQGGRRARCKFNDSQQDVYVEVQFQGSYDDVAQKVAAALVAKQAPDLAILSDVTWERFFLNDALEPLKRALHRRFRPGRLPAEAVRRVQP